MKKLFADSTTFDFRSKRVKMNGRVMTKFDIAYVAKCIDYYSGLCMDVFYKYDDCKSMFLDLLLKSNFFNVIVVQ